MIDRKDNRRADAMAAEPGDHPEIEAKAVGPGALVRVGDELETRVDIQGAPLEVRNTTAVQVGKLFCRERFMVSDVLQVHLDDLEGLGLVPVDKGSRAARTQAPRPGKPVSVATENVTDRGPRDSQVFIVGEVASQALRPEPRAIFSSDHLLFHRQRCSSWLTKGRFGSVAQVAFPLLATDSVDSGSCKAKGAGGQGNIVITRSQVIQDRASSSDRIQCAEGLVVNTDASSHAAPSQGAPDLTLKGGTPH